MRLNDVESKVWAAIGVRGDASIRELAAITGLPQHRCRRALDSLFMRSLLKRRVVVDPARIGYSIFGLWFSLSPAAAKKHGPLLSFLKSSPSVAYLGEFEGEYRYKMDIYGQSAAAVDSLLGEATCKFGDVFSSRALSCSLSVCDFPHKRLAPDLPAGDALVIGTAAASIKLAELDHAILQMLTSSVDKSHLAMAQRLQIAATTFDYRVKRMREQRIIAGFHVFPDVEIGHGLGITMHVHCLRLNRLDSKTRTQIQNFAASDTAVCGITHSTGRFDLELCTASVSIAEDREFRSRLEDKFGNMICEHSGSSVLKHYKINSYPFADLPGRKSES